jgi:hypothetical protein
VKCYIGNGVVLSASKLFEEIEGLERAGVEVRSRLRISEACPLILPFHAALDVAQQQPVVLPAALVLKPLEKGKQYERIELDSTQVLTEESQKQVLKDWNDTGDFSGFDMTQNEACKLHRDWQFILQEQDATALLQYACDHYSYALYQPIFEFLRVE